MQINEIASSPCKKRAEERKESSREKEKEAFLENG